MFSIGKRVNSGKKRPLAECRPSIMKDIDGRERMQ